MSRAVKSCWLSATGSSDVLWTYCYWLQVVFREEVPEEWRSSVGMAAAFSAIVRLSVPQMLVWSTKVWNWNLPLFILWQGGILKIPWPIFLTFFCTFSWHIIEVLYIMTHSRDTFSWHISLTNYLNTFSTHSIIPHSHDGSPGRKLQLNICLNFSPNHSTLKSFHDENCADCSEGQYGAFHCSPNNIFKA